MNLEKIPCFGVAGNFTGHLEQAGEARDFVNVVVASQNAPKAVFPTYIPFEWEVRPEITPEFLSYYPVDPEKIVLPLTAEEVVDQKFQIEPECAIICDAKWDGEKLVSLEPAYFAASNDCSIRREGAKKISEKKNWGASSKGISANYLKIDKFDKGGLIDGYRIASYLLRDGHAYQYGEDSAIRDYSYIYDTLIEWLIDKFNNQQCEGPAERIHDYLVEAGCPSKILVSIGATRYTEFGEKNFLKVGDASVVVLYPENKYSADEITTLVESNDFSDSEISVLAQKIISK